MKEKLIELLKEKEYIGKTGKELADYFKVEYNSEFMQLLTLLEEAGDIAKSSKDRYFLSEKLGIYKGVVLANKKGFAFINIGKEHDDIFVSKDNLNGALDKDLVLVKVLSKKSDNNSEEGIILKVIERGIKQVVGEFIDGDGIYYVVPDDLRIDDKIEIFSDALAGAVAGHKVVVSIFDYEPKLTGEIIQILGHKNDPGVDILSIIARYDIEVEFSDEIYQSLDKIPAFVKEEDLMERMDLRDEVIVTIDGDDAKDLDDAISLKKLANGNFQLGVHIADVSHYVKEGSFLDKEAVNRGTSIYLVDRVIPMLPHKLSNGICSLHPDVDRLTISCFMEIAGDGSLVNYEIKESVIHSKQRMTYQNVNKILDNDIELTKRYQGYIELFFLMEELAAILRNKREQRGSIDFDLNESKILIDDKGKAIDIVLRERGKSEKVIEEFMLLANETVASCVKWLDLPFIYRIHEKPQVKKLQKFSTVAKTLGYSLKGSLQQVYPNQLSSFVEEIKGTEAHTLLATLLLRCMSKAKYSEEALGHFGLASENYTHFTSPIRRYPDLLVHRLLRAYLFEGKINPQAVEHFSSVIPQLAESSSNCEMIAINLERDVESMKKAEYMLSHIGDIYEGLISSVTAFGMFVELDNTIEGLVHMMELKDDYYHFDEINMRLVGERTGRIYKMSDRIKIQVKAVNKEDGNIDFSVLKQKKKNSKFSNKFVKSNSKKPTSKGIKNQNKPTKSNGLTKVNGRINNKSRSKKRK